MREREIERDMIHSRSGEIDCEIRKRWTPGRYQDDITDQSRSKKHPDIIKEDECVEARKGREEFGRTDSSSLSYYSDGRRQNL